MGRNPKFSKEVKIKVCEAYKAGKGSYKSLAQNIGASESIVKEWYSLYKFHSENAFESSNRNASYTREFKQAIIESFISGKHSAMELGGKYNISVSMVRKWVNLYNNGIEIKDYDPKGVVYTMKSRKTTFEERLEIAKWVVAHDMNYKEAANRYAIKYALIYQWVQKYLAGGEDALRHKKRGPKPKQEIDESSLNEVERLKLELEREKALRERAEFKLKLLKKKRGIRTKASLSKVRQEATYLAIDCFQKKGYPVKLLCEEFGVARSAYYKNKKRVKPAKEIQDELLCSLIHEYHAMYDGILGYRRMTMFINRLNQTDYSEGYIHRLMSFLGITARIRKKKVNRKRVKPDYVKENILARDFNAEKPNAKWLTDVTEFSLPGEKRKLYLSPIMDLYDNSIVEYELSFRNNNLLVFKMFDRAIMKIPNAKPIFHSDRGFQYTNRVFKDKLEKAEMTQSMSRVGKCIDNGPMEGFFGILKSEMFYGKTFKSLDELKEKIKRYITFYNEERFQKRLKCLAPMEYRNQALTA